MNKQADKLFKDGKHEEAIKLIVDELNQNFEQLDLILQLSSYLVEVDDPEQAEELLLRALSIFKDDDDLRYNLGNVYFTAGDYQKANNLFQELIRSDYGFEAYYMEAKALQGEGSTQLAIMYAITAQERVPKDILATELLASLLMSNGNFEAAKEYYLKAMEIKPTAEDYFNLALCEMNTNGEYKSLLNKSKELDSKYFEEHETKLSNIQDYLKETETDNG